MLFNTQDQDMDMKDVELPITTNQISQINKVLDEKEQPMNKLLEHKSEAFWVSWDDNKNTKLNKSLTPNPKVAPESDKLEKQVEVIDVDMVGEEEHNNPDMNLTLHIQALKPMKCDGKDDVQPEEEGSNERSDKSEEEINSLKT